MSDNYEVYRAPGNDPAAQPTVEPGSNEEQAPWQVLVEYSNGGQLKPPTVVNVFRRTYATRAEALAAAQKKAFSFDPPDPLSPKGRAVFKDGSEGFLTVVRGAMSTFHFSTRIVQLLASD